MAPQVFALLIFRISAAELIMVGPDKGDGSLGRTLDKAKKLGVAGPHSPTGNGSQGRSASLAQQRGYLHKHHQL